VECFSTFEGGEFSRGKAEEGTRKDEASHRKGVDMNEVKESKGTLDKTMDCKG